MCLIKARADLKPCAYTVTENFTQYYTQTHFATFVVIRAVLMNIHFFWNMSLWEGVISHKDSNLKHSVSNSRKIFGNIKLCDNLGKSYFFIHEVERTVATLHTA